LIVIISKTLLDIHTVQLLKYYNSIRYDLIKAYGAIVISLVYAKAVNVVKNITLLNVVHYEYTPSQIKLVIATTKSQSP